MRHPIRTMLPWLAVFPLGCGVTTFDLFENCEIEVRFDETSGAPGATIVARGGPFTEISDTLVFVDGAEAEVLGSTNLDSEGVDRAGECSECDLCRLESTCAPCGACAGRILEPSRRVECFGDPYASEPVLGVCDLCAYQMTFAVPEVAAGDVDLWMINRFGTSPNVAFTVGEPTNTDTGR